MSTVLCIIITLLHRKHRKKVVVVETNYKEHDFQMSPNVLYVSTEQDTMPENEYEYYRPTIFVTQPRSE